MFIKKLASILKSNRGYSLAELSISVSIIAMLAVGGLSIMEKKNASDSVSETYEKITRIQDALKSFAATKQYLPCPSLPNIAESSVNFGKSEGLTVSVPEVVSVATMYNNANKVTVPDTHDACSNNGLLALFHAGAVPVRTLGLSDDDTYDGWGRKFTYRIANGAGTKDDFTDLRFKSDLAVVDRKGIHKTNINNPPPYNSGAAYVIVSYGENGKTVAWRKNDATAPAKATGLEESNTDHVRKVYVQSEKTEGFDDIVAYGLKQNFIESKNVSAPIQIEALTCDNAKKMLDDSREVLNNFNSNGGAGGRADLIFKAAKKISIMCDNAPSNNMNPAVLANLVLWLDAADNTTLFTNANCVTGAEPTNNASIACWKDKSGNGYNATTGVAPSYIKSGINGKPIIRLNGSQYLNVSNTAMMQKMSSGTATGSTVFIAVKPTVLGANSLLQNRPFNSSVYFNAQVPYNDGYVYWQNGNASANGQLLATAGAPAGSAYIWVLNSAGTASQNIWRNGTLIGTKANAELAAFGTSYTLDIGANNRTNFYNGDLAEIIIYNRALDAKERPGIQSYLADKWGVTLATTAERCSKGMTFRKSKEHPKGSCQCPMGQAYITELVSSNACNIPANNAFSGCVAVNTPPTYNPGPTDAGMALWLDANDCSKVVLTKTGNKVMSWQDKSPNARNATQSVDANRPVYTLGGASTINSLPVIRLNGSTQYFDLATLSSLTAGEIFVVSKILTDPPTLESQTGFWIMGASGEKHHFPWTDGRIYDDFGSTLRRALPNPGQKLTLPNIYNVSSISGEWAATLNGIQLYTSTNNTVSFNFTPSIGRDASHYFAGDMAEMVLYDRKLSTTDRTAVMTYLSTKWAIALTPAAIGSSNLKLWLDASDASTIFEGSGCTGLNPNAGDAIGCWKDKSGNANHAKQTNKFQRPTYAIKARNDKPVIVFDGKDDQFSVLLDINYNVMPAVTIITAYQFKPGSTNGGQGLWGHDNTVWDRFMLLLYSGLSSSVSAGSTLNMSTDMPGLRTTNTWQIFTTVYNYGVSLGGFAYLNGTAGANFTETHSNTGDTVFYIGSIASYTDRNAKADISEFMLYNIAMTTAQRQMAEGMMGDRWGITLQ